MKLYYHPLSTFSQKVLLAFYEKGIEFEREVVNLMDPEGRKRLEAIYPYGKVPLLVVGGPRFEEGSAGALGVDRIFGRGTTPGEVASYLVHALVTPPTTQRKGA